jgi:catechol 2,3-dioxygenase-like lactoylglutathione lyase family enzyme
MTRVRFHAAVICAILALAVPPAARAADVASGRALAVGCIGLTVSDLDRSTDFYERVLSFRREGDGAEVTGERWESLTGVFGLRARIARLRLGGECVELTEYLAPRGRPAPADAQSNDRWFQHVAIVVADMDEAYRRLRAAKVEHASSGPQRLPDWNPNAGGIRAFYFKDPDRHVLEVIWFPRGKGDPRWQAPRSDGALFLGIDHTAIVVADTEASLRFWRDALGLRVAGESENWGVEQEHLNNVFGARLRLGKMSRRDALAYVIAQFSGGVAGVAVSWALLGDTLSHASTRFVATVPGRAGSAAAFAAEIVISFTMMAVVLAVSSTRRARLTGVCAAILVASFIVVVAPISGMSLNSARCRSPG